MNIVNWLIARLKEPSTWSGTGILAIGLSLAGVDSEIVQKALTVGIAVSGLLSVMLKEKAND